MARRRANAARLQTWRMTTSTSCCSVSLPGPAAYRSNLGGVLDVGFPVLWNIRREER